MARAGAHLTAGRLAEAQGVYSAILNIDPAEYRAHLGLADCAMRDGRVDDAVERLAEGSRSYAEAGSMRPAFALMTKALAIAPSRLDLHIDVAELEAADDRAEMAALRLENLARTYLVAGQAEEAELVLEAATAFRAAAAPPTTSRVTAAPKRLQPAPPPIHDRAQPSPIAARKAKRSSRGVANALAPQWCPSTVMSEPPPRRNKARRAATQAVRRSAAIKRAIAPAPRPCKQAKPGPKLAKKRPCIAPAPSPKRGGKKLDKLPPLRLVPSVASRLRAATSSVRAGPSEEDRTTMWHRPTPTPA